MKTKSTILALGLPVMNLAAQVQIIDNPYQLNPAHSAGMGSQFVSPVNQAIIMNGQSQLAAQKMLADQAFAAQQQRSNQEFQARMQQRQIESDTAGNRAIKDNFDKLLDRLAAERAVEKEAKAKFETIFKSNQSKIQAGIQIGQADIERNYDYLVFTLNPVPPIPSATPFFP